MIPFYRLLEVAIYSLLNYLPFMCLALYPFRSHFRFSPAATNALIVLSCVVHILLGILATFCPISTGLLSLATTVIYILIYFLAVKVHLGKLVFTLLVFSNITNLMVIGAKSLEFLLFGDLALESYRWSMSLCLLALHLVFTVPIFFYIRSHYKFATKLHGFTWCYLWTIPATFYIIWYYHMYLTGQSSLDVALNIRSTLFLLVINLGAMAIYHTAVMLLLEREKAQQLSFANYQLNMHKLQYDNLQSRINEARQAKHDVHHHTYLIREYLKSGKLQELEAYLDKYTASLPSIQSLIHCQHHATNVLLGHFAQQAQDNGIEMDIFVQLPETINLPETSLSVVLGNLLENAIEACMGIPEGEKKITIRGKAEPGSVFFEITNTFNGELRRDKTGKILSTKATSRGLGLESVAHLALTHNGMLETDAKDGIFRASILLSENAPQHPDLL